MNDTPQSVAQALARAVADGSSLDEPLDRALELTGARATGLWKLEDGALRQLGFRGVADMPEEVKRDFAAATRVVPMERIGLGIVKAAVDGAPAVSERVAGSRDLNASPGWLERFECARSLAVPVWRMAGATGDESCGPRIASDDAGAPWGVLAISLSALLRPGEPPWSTLEAIAATMRTEIAPERIE